METKYKHNPAKLLAVLYILNFIAVNTVSSKVPLWMQFILGVLHMVSVYFGTYFQCIGLTGGIATGKSTVSGILAENGFDIIDTDRISKEVSQITSLFIPCYHKNLFCTHEN